MTSFDRNTIIIGQICEKIQPGKKMLQKLMYLIDRKGLNLDLNYAIHYFGPYSSKLDSTMHTLESYDKLSIDTSGSTHIIRPGVVQIEGNLEKQDQQKVDFVMENFSERSAHDLEAITTIDYVAVTMLKGQGSDSEIIEKVKQIKNAKFSQDFLFDCLGTLKRLKYLA